jgi:hypothetical protein
MPGSLHPRDRLHVCHQAGGQRGWPITLDHFVNSSNVTPLMVANK